MDNFLSKVELINNAINGFVWGLPMLVLLVGTGILMTCLTKFFQISHFKHWISNTIGGIFKDSKVTAHTHKEDTQISQFQSLCTALAATIGTGNIAGVAAAIASGGELSRIMLAVKTIIAEKDEIATLIFDEIDTGISGSAASKVGKKLRQLSQTHQVLCITHQAQIAALADTHLFISKSVSEGRTYTKIRQLDFEERKYELSRIIDGDSPSELSLKHAEEMLNSK